LIIHAARAAAAESDSSLLCSDENEFLDDRKRIQLHEELLGKDDFWQLSRGIPNKSTINNDLMAK
jgi:hypothetical protein